MRVSMGYNNPLLKDLNYRAEQKPFSDWSHNLGASAVLSIFNLFFSAIVCRSVDAEFVCVNK